MNPLLSVFQKKPDTKIMSYRVILVKLLPKEYLDDFLNGNLHLNTLDYFAAVDASDKVRHDLNDGLFESRQVSSVSIKDQNGSWVPIKGIINPVTSKNDDLCNFNVLCMYSITDRDSDCYDKRNNEFGEVAVIINDIQEFIYRIRMAAEDKGWEIRHKPVEYVSRKNHDGYMGPFRKFEEFSFQNEFRFLFKTDLRDSCKLNVGSLREIVQIIESDKISDLWPLSR